MKWTLLLLLSFTLPASAIDPAPATLISGRGETSHTQPPPKMEQTKNVSQMMPKKHWWDHVVIFWPLTSQGRGGQLGESIEIQHYHGLSSRPWSAISANPPYMSNDMDCRVHHPNCGIGGSY